MKTNSKTKMIGFGLIVWSLILICILNQSPQKSYKVKSEEFLNLKIKTFESLKKESQHSSFPVEGLSKDEQNASLEPLNNVIKELDQLVLNSDALQKNDAFIEHHGDIENILKMSKYIALISSEMRNKETILIGLNAFKNCSVSIKLKSNLKAMCASRYLKFSKKILFNQGFDESYYLKLLDSETIQALSHFI